MRWSLAVMMAALTLAGCKSGANVVDPFVGPTRVAPPRTGWITGQTRGDPYYPDQPRSAKQPTLPAQASAAPSPAGSGWVAPAGGSVPVSSGAGLSPAFEANRSSVRIPSPVVGAESQGRYPDRSAGIARPSDQPGPVADGRRDSAIRAAATSSAVASAGSPAAGEGVIRIVEPRSRPAPAAAPGPTAIGSSVAGGQEPGRIDAGFSAGARSIGGASGSRVVPATVQAVERPGAPGASTDIIDLPKTRGGVTSIGTTGRASDGGGVRLASATSEVGSSQSGQPTPVAADQEAASFSPRARYGYDSQYRWLRGKLEYSQIDRRWKLRYIPIDGKTDDYGGSVVLSDATMLSGYERGEFVEVHGRLAQRSKDDHNFSPVYEAAEIKRAAG